MEEIYRNRLAQRFMMCGFNQDLSMNSEWCTVYNGDSWSWDDCDGSYV